LSALWLACLSGLGGPPPHREVFQTFTEREGLPQRYIQSLAMDRQGRLWAGTLAGVAVYEGQRWRTLEPPPSSFGLFVNSNAITPMSDGSVWIGTRHQGVLEYRDGTWRVHEPAQGGPSENVNALLESTETGPDGRPVIWAATYGKGLGRWSQGRWTRVEVPDPRLFCLLERPGPAGRPTLWIGSTRGIWILEGGQVRPFEGNAQLPSLKVRSLEETRDAFGVSNLWIGMEDGGLWRWREGRLESVKTAGPSGSEYVRAMVRDGGDLWVATVGGGVGRWRDGAWTWLQASSGLPTALTRCLALTPGGRQGRILWIGTEGQGVLRYAAAPLRPVDLPWSGPDQRVLSFTETLGPEGSTPWLGGATQGLLSYREGRWRPNPTSGPLVPNVRILYRIPGDRDLYVVHGRGLSRLSHGRLEPLAGSQELPEGQIRALAGTLESGRSILWVATSRGLYRWDGQTFQRLPHPPSDPSGALRSLTLDGPRLWVGTERGLACLEGGNWVASPVLKQLQGFSVSSILPVQRDSGDHELWLGTFGSGVYRVRNPEGAFTVEHLTVHSTPGVPNHLVKNLELDREGRVYVATSGGLARYAPGPFGLVRDDLTLEEGLPSPECNVGGVWRDSGGRIWVGTQDGVAFLDPNHDPPLGSQARLSLNAASARGDALPPGTRLAHGEQKLRFEFALWTYYREQDTRFRTQLVGLQSTPTPWRPEPFAEFLTLPPGSYVLKVWGRDWTGRESGPVSFPFAVKPAPWATGWALTVYALLAASAVAGLLRLRTRVMAERNRDLEARIQEATAEVRTQKQALERLTQELLASNQQKDAFMGIAAHDLRNPLSGIVLSVDLLDEEDDLAEVRRTLHSIKDQSHAMAHLIGRFHEINRIDSGRVQAELQPVEVGDLLRAKVGEFLPKAQEKAISLGHELPEAPVWATADPGFLGEVLDNLLSNALKFSPRDREVKVRMDVTAEAVRIQVQDQGPGLTPEDRTRLFGRFARLSARPTGGEPSVGLGLSIVKHMVDAMDGQIDVHSEPGRGACFSVTLGQAEPEAQTLK